MNEYVLDLPSDKNKTTTIFPANIHICHFYKSKDDLFELLLPYFAEGLRQGEFCLWGVAEPLTVHTAVAGLDAFMEGQLTPYIKSGQMEIFDVSRLYGTGVFDALAVKDAFLQKVNASGRNGWHGFRCDGMASMVSPANWVNYQTYELEVTRSLAGNVTALCSYDLTKITSEKVIDVVSSHQASLIRKNLRWTVLQSAESMMLKETQRKEKEFRQLADSMPQLAWMANAFGAVYWYNRRWHDYTGLTLEQVNLKGWQSVYEPSELPKVLQLWKNSVETGKTFEMVVALRGADGVYLPFLTRAMPLRDQAGNVTRWFGTCTDVSEITPLLKEASKEA